MLDSHTDAEIVAPSPTVAWRPQVIAEQSSRPTDPFSLLERLGTKVTVKRGREIYAEGDASDCCYKLVKGTVRTVKLLSNGRRQVCEFLMPGELFGFETQDNYFFSAEAVTDAVLLRYSKRSVERLIGAEPALAQQIRCLTSSGLQGAYERMVLLCHKSAQQRVAWFLLNIAERSGTYDDDFAILHMTRTDIADYLGMALETVSRVLGQFKRNNIISVEGISRISFKDRDELVSVCGGD